MVEIFAEIVESRGVPVLQWLPEELAAWSAPELLPTRQFAERYVRIPGKIAVMPGPIRISLTAYLGGVFDAYDDPGVDEITLAAGTQVGKTLALYVMLLSGLVQRPGPRLLVMPVESDAREVAGDVLREYCLACEPLMERVTGDGALMKEGYQIAGGNLYFGWSNSPASMGRRSCRDVFGDELEDWPSYSGKTTDAPRQMKNRLRAWRNTTGAKAVWTSSPRTVDGLIWRSWLASDQRRFHVPCPSCGKYQVLVWDQVRWPRDPETDRSVAADQIEEKNLARYRCLHCQAEWTEQEKNAAVRLGVWAALGQAVSDEGRVVGTPERPGRHAGFHVTALLSPFVTMSQLAAKFLEAKDASALQDFTNNELGEVWLEVETAVDVQALRKHRSEGYQRARWDEAAGCYQGRLPSADIQLVTAFIDVQARSFYVSCRGWGFSLESWVLDYRQFVTEEELYHYLSTTSWSVPGEVDEGDESPVKKIGSIMIDSGDEATYVYDLCDRWRDLEVRPTKGGSTDAMPDYRTTVRRQDPRTKRKYTADVVLFVLHPSRWKDRQAAMQNNPEPGPRYMHLPSDVDEDYLRQITSEAKTRPPRIGKGGRRNAQALVWMLRPGFSANHYWDCEVGNTFQAEVLGLRHLEPGQTLHRPTFRRRRVGRVSRP